MTDVFLKVWTDSPLREGLSDAVIARWMLQMDACLMILDAENIGKENFHIESKKMAEQMARSSIYIVADDDHLILGEDFVRKGVETLGNHPEYGLLSAASMIENHDLLKSSQDVIELHAVGCPYFIRKGTITEWPNCPPGQMDGHLCKHITDKGLKTGIMPKVRYNHLGYGYSQVSPSHWSAT